MKPKLVESADRPTSTMSVAERTILREVDRRMQVMAVAMEERLAAVVAAHNELDTQVQNLYYRVLFVMQQVRVRRTLGDSVILGPNEQPRVEEGSLYEFFQKDGPAFIAAVQAQEQRIAQALAERARLAGGATGTDAAQDAGQNAAPADGPLLAPGSRTIS